MKYVFTCTAEHLAYLKSQAIMQQIARKLTAHKAAQHIDACS